MTVCVAAICEAGSAIVVAADRMFTFTAPVSLEFETGEKKIDQLARACVAMTAGNSSVGKEIVSAILKTLAGAQTPTIDVVAELAKTAYIEARANRVRETIVIPMLGPDYLKHERFNVTVANYLEKQAGMYQNIAIQANNLNLGTEFMVAGIDDGGARLAYVGHPGTLAWLDKLGYGSIGSGAIHATMRLALAGQSRATSLQDAFYRVYEAKRASEVAPGVGPTTDMAIVRREGVTMCSKDTLDQVARIFNDTRGNLAPDLARIANAPELQPPAPVAGG